MALNWQSSLYLAKCKDMPDVIFLIDSEAFNGETNLICNTLEKYIECKVYNFSSLEESFLYGGLKPKIIIHDSNEIKNSPFDVEVKYYSILNIESKFSEYSNGAMDLVEQIKSLI